MNSKNSRNGCTDVKEFGLIFKLFLSSLVKEEVTCLGKAINM